MTQQEMFGMARWVGAPEQPTDSKESGEKYLFPILQRQMAIGAPVKKAVLRVVGLGFFHCYINGEPISSDEFLPLATDYEPRTDYPVGETLTDHRIWVPEYDITARLHPGENTLTLHFGGGWYASGPHPFGRAKAIYRLMLEYETGEVQEFLSSAEDELLPSLISAYDFTQFEAQDYLGLQASAPSTLHAVEAVPPQKTEYGFSNCPPDRVAAVLPAVQIGEADGVKYYDAGRNLSGWPVLRLRAKAGETVTVMFSEEPTQTGAPHPCYHYGQRFTVVSDGTARVVRPLFTWFGFRYFSVAGDAEVEGVAFVHANVMPAAHFHSDNVTLNWLFDTYVHTQLCNMHAGLPSDCPHIERRGYTGDGQLTCGAAMTVLNARTFYEKWMQDISDCQDVASGHIQYTAPYVQSGGGPGGWGCAIVEVPYQFYRHYGDASWFARLYPQMLRYLDYLEAHSVNELVASDKPGEWCLGDWCSPGGVILPAAFVNTCFYVRSLERMIALAPVIGRGGDIPALRAIAARKRAAITAAYFNTWDGSFLCGRQGADAFAVALGLGDARTYAHLVQYYRNLGRLDTGIFGTEEVIRVLSEHGDGVLAMQLLASTQDGTYDHWRRLGATTLWEYWPHDAHERSRNHPMFGAPAAYLVSVLAGIQPAAPGYAAVRIAPLVFAGVSKLDCTQQLPTGAVTVRYEIAEGKMQLHVIVPQELRAELVWAGQTYPLHSGEQSYTLEVES